jgi:hypothetical protein
MLEKICPRVARMPAVGLSEGITLHNIIEQVNTSVLLLIILGMQVI